MEKKIFHSLYMRITPKADKGISRKINYKTMPIINKNLKVLKNIKIKESSVI
jgi:hypothetical protein